MLRKRENNDSYRKSMDLLDSVLRTAGAEKYLSNFRDAEIKAQHLKILTEKDLELIGIDDPAVRKNLLKNTKNLVVQSEKRITTAMDDDYIELVLLQISKQMTQHHANLICAAKRPDIINCDVQLEEATNSLLTVMKDFKSDLLSLKDKLQIKKESNRINVKKSIFYTSLLGVIVWGSFIVIHKWSK